MQSCWIQRLNPACQTSAFEEDEPEPSPVWTHFTKDFSSCSKRLHKVRHHSRSSSWPPNERTTNCPPSPDRKLVEPVDIKEEFLLSRATLPKSPVPFQDGSESITFCFKTGNKMLSQNCSHKPGSTLEALVPCSHVARTCNDFHAGKRNDEGMLKDSAAQRLYSKFTKESGSLLEIGSDRVLGDNPCKVKLSAFELAHTKAYTRGCSPDAVIGTSLSPALMGASADADDRTCISCPLIESVYLSTPSKLSIDGPAVVFGKTENKINKDRPEMVLNKYPGKDCGKELKTTRNFGFLHVAGQTKKLNQLGANPCTCGSGLSRASKSIQRKTNVGFGTFGTNAGPFVPKESYKLQSLNKDLRRYDPFVADRPCSPMEESDTKIMPPTKASYGDFARASCRETSLDEYWVQLVEDSGPVELFDSSYPKASPLGERITDGCYKFSFNVTANSWKPDENEKLKSFPHPSAQAPLNSNVQSNSFIQTKQTGLGHNANALAKRSPLEGTSILKTWQEDSLQGGIKRLVSKTGKKELFPKFYDDGRTTGPSNWNEAWIQRWVSSSNLRTMSMKALLTSFRMDKEKGSPPKKRPVIISSKGLMDVDSVDHNLLVHARSSKLHMDGSVRCYDSGLGATSTRGSFPVQKSYARSKHMAPSVTAMAIVGNTACKLHTTALENRGSFSVWPCPREENFQERRKPVEDNMQGMDMDDLEFLKHR